MGITCSVRELGSKCFWKRATKACANCLASGLFGWESCTLLRNCSIPASISCCPRFFAPVTSISSRMRTSFCGSIVLAAWGAPLAEDWGLAAAVFSCAFTHSDGEWARTATAPERSAHPTSNGRIYSLPYLTETKGLSQQPQLRSPYELCGVPRVLGRDRAR